jgi:tRNA (guanine-N7-)-methyltransferase
MTKAQRQAIEDHADRFLIDNPTTFHPRQLFPQMREVVVEIGSGMGEATAQISRTFPEKGFLAIEVHRPGIGSLILRAVALELQNLKVINDDCHLILDLIEDGSVDTFHIFFPDPWPKTKHKKRRLINDDFSRLLATKLRIGGELLVATDWQEYASHIERVLDSNSLLTGGVVERPPWRPLTKFESQGIDKQHEVTDFRYRRI